MNLNERKRIIGQAFGLPSELADRLVGENDAELVADAKALGRAVQARTATAAPIPGSGSAGNPAQQPPALTLDQVKGMTLDEVRRRLPEVIEALKGQRKA